MGVEGEGQASTKFEKKGDLTRSQFFRGGCCDREGDLFQRRLQFLHKNKVNSEMFNVKKVYKLKCFSLS